MKIIRASITQEIELDREFYLEKMKARPKLASFFADVAEKFDGWDLQEEAKRITQEAK